MLSLIRNHFARRRLDQARQEFSARFNYLRQAKSRGDTREIGRRSKELAQANAALLRAEAAVTGAGR